MVPNKSLNPSGMSFRGLDQLLSDILDEFVLAFSRRIKTEFLKNHIVLGIFAINFNSNHVKILKISLMTNFLPLPFSFERPSISLRPHPPRF